MSVQTLKDLYLAIKLQLDIYEKDFGEITTAFSRKIEKQKEDDAAKAAPSRRRAKG